jgi:Rne/Rng family ribonuclease
VTDDRSPTPKSGQPSTTEEDGAERRPAAPSRTRTRSARPRAVSAGASDAVEATADAAAAPVRRTRRRPAQAVEEVPADAPAVDGAVEGRSTAPTPRTRKSAPAKAKAAKAPKAAATAEPGTDAVGEDVPSDVAPAPRKRAPRKATAKKAAARRSSKATSAGAKPEPAADGQGVDADAPPPPDGIEVVPAADALDDAVAAGVLAEQGQPADGSEGDVEVEGADADGMVAPEQTEPQVADAAVEEAAADADDADADADADDADVDGAAVVGDAAGGDGGTNASSETTIKRRRRRRGGRRGRGRGTGGGGDGDGAAAPSEQSSGEPEGGDGDESSAEGTAAPSGKAQEQSGEKAAQDTSDGEANDDTAARDGGAKGKRDSAAGTTRLQARNRGRSGSSGGRSRGKGGGRRPAGGVSEETRRAITEGPPRRMLVNLGEERTQVAVLEERTLVEHYVTRKEDVSYVGNIYLGRVQNVLPGMEAAFVDIGKGRNGVLYAGEVNYDEADLDGDLPRIEDHLKPGQTVLVQVTKDPMGTKGARLTQNLSIAGRYCVLAPGDGMLGISRKLTDEERDRLRKVLKSIRPEGFGLIVRTAAEGATQEQLEADVARLTRIWEQVQTKAKQVKPLDAVYEEPHLVMRVIRDVFGSDFNSLVVDSEELAEQIRDYLTDVSPEMVEMVAVHTGEEKIFDAYEVTNQVRRALEKKVWLKSGGYLIIEKTEAMWVIDVNTGKFVGKDNLEETVLKNNLESADEIARQLRLRDMGGIIVIDFVDMLVPANRDEVLKRFKRELARDKTKSRVMDISKLGLVQMTRKNVSQGLTETFTTTCDVCEGRGATILDQAFN